MLMLVTGAEEGSRGSHAQIILRESKWFDISDGDVPDRPRSRIVASRWVGYAADRCEHQAEIAADCHVISITLQPMADVTVFAGQKLVHDGHLPRGSVRVNEPGVAMRGIFRGAYDELHLHVPNEMIAEYANAECGQVRTMPLIADRPVVNPVIERLARSLIRAEELGGSFGQSYVDGISLAITAQLLGGSSDGTSASRPRVSGLPKWRLKRAIEYIHANLSESISLADIASAAGLSRMHFAAQFRVTTGLRPHEFLLQKRIEHAQKLLLTMRMPLVEIALDAGFKTQAHFTTVFARLVGETPNVWRQRAYKATEVPTLQAA
jgi:AraC family transcriptional regulator